MVSILVGVKPASLIAFQSAALSAVSSALYLMNVRPLFRSNEIEPTPLTRSTERVMLYVHPGHVTPLTWIIASASFAVF